MKKLQLFRNNNEVLIIHCILSLKTRAFHPFSHEYEVPEYKVCKFENYEKKLLQHIEDNEIQLKIYSPALIR